MQRQALRWRRQGKPIALVPTMGCLHAGHLSLIRRARRHVGPAGVVAVSVFVNPIQFAPTEDFSRYPRDVARDRRLCREAGVDVLFWPSGEAMYPGRRAGAYSTYIVEESLAKVMEGASRPTHFRGVTTVVGKLFHIVLPDAAVFGAKDFQQAAIIRRMVRDLNYPVRVIVAPTVREADGLAMSSRNQYLEGPLRAQAGVLWRAIRKARGLVRASRRPVAATRLKQQLAWFIEEQPAARVDYIEVFDPATLQPSDPARRGRHLALAVLVGKTRLIDNGRL